MNTKIKLLLTAVMAIAVLTFSPQAVRAQGVEDSQDKINNGSPEATEAINGFCPVCLINGKKVKGKDNFTTEYKGKVYKFAGFDQQKMFLADPDKYVTDLDAKFNALNDDGIIKKDNNWEEGSH
ncbi:MAG: hypothetical protein KGJ11_00360 [Candidatus Omnitrophica bacterium]|nr:hypothetical protein [Candidatus Omnitrophota bacterium]